MPKLTSLLIRDANVAYRAGRIDAAIRLYSLAESQYPELSKCISALREFCERSEKRRAGEVLISSRNDECTPDQPVSTPVLKNIGAFLKKLTKENEDSVSVNPETLQSDAASREKLKLMVGMLYSGEGEYHIARERLNRQSLKYDTLRVIKFKGNVEAHNELYSEFLASDADLLVKVDADMVIVDESFFSRITAMAAAYKDKAIFQIGILDFYSGRQIQGINIYTKKLKWDVAATDQIFTDRTKVFPHERRLVWTTFLRSVLHSPSPTPFQAFHFGVHRGIKSRISSSRGDGYGEKEQQDYIINTYRHFKLRKTEPLRLAALGGFMALNGRFDSRSIDYTEGELQEFFTRNYTQLLQDDYIDREKALLAEKIGDSKLGASPIDTLWVKSVCFLIPHLEIYGGNLRFFEIARVLTDLGISASIAVQALSDSSLCALRREDRFGDIRILKVEEAIKLRWDVVVCGDFSSGLLLHLPFFDCGLSVAYLLNGFQHRHINRQQIDAAEPELVLANSSYSASCYPELTPIVLPGGVDTDLFVPNQDATSRNGESFNIVTFVGRRKSRKRFIDAYKACQRISKLQNKKITMSTICVDALEDLSIGRLQHTHYRNPTRTDMPTILRSADVVLLPEEDAGWNNPAAEAMACGRPVVCTAAGTTDFAFDRRTALVVPSRSPEALADACVELLADRLLAKDISIAGREVISQYSWASVGQKLLDIFEDSEKAVDYRQAVIQGRRRRLSAFLRSQGYQK
jgi:glycosyltransferase involved in cell wall biosynthesis